MFAMTDIKRLEREYEYKRNEANRVFLEEKKQAYQNNPRLLELDLAIKKTGIAAMKNQLQNDTVKKEENKKILENDLKKLTAEKEAILKKIKFPSMPQYSCMKCHDTGYISTPNGTSMCSCMKQILINEAYHDANLYGLKNETFGKLDFSLFSDTPDRMQYRSDLSPRENMEKIVSISHDFIENFSSETQKNLLFTGTTGTGKTFLSSSIASEIIGQGYTVLYQTAPILFDKILEYKYDNKIPNSKALYDQFFQVNLLVIDDLGTENLTSAKFAELFTILNSRLITPNTKTIISTNLSLEELNKTYDARILSRLIGSYTICRFFGNDIRLKKQL